MQGRLYRMALWAAVIGLMAVIFAFSAQQGEASEALTKGAVLPVAELIAAMQQGTQATIDTLYFIMGTILRKAAHLAEYGLLGALIWLLLESYGHRGKLLPISIAALYAITDELHQAFVPGRLGMPLDVLVDAIGAVAGVYIVSWIYRYWRK